MAQRQIFVLTTAFLLQCSVALGQLSLPLAPHAHVATILGSNMYGSEPSIALNPNSSNQVLAAFQSATVVYSTDQAQSLTSLIFLPFRDGAGGVDVFGHV